MSTLVLELLGELKTFLPEVELDRVLPPDIAWQRRRFCRQALSNQCAAHCWRFWRSGARDDGDAVFDRLLGRPKFVFYHKCQQLIS